MKTVFNNDIDKQKPYWGEWIGRNKCNWIFIYDDSIAIHIIDFRIHPSNKVFYKRKNNYSQFLLKHKYYLI